MKRVIFSFYYYPRRSKPKTLTIILLQKFPESCDGPCSLSELFIKILDSNGVVNCHKTILDWTVYFPRDNIILESIIYVGWDAQRIVKMSDSTLLISKIKLTECLFATYKVLKRSIFIHLVPQNLGTKLLNPCG